MSIRVAIVTVVGLAAIALVATEPFEIDLVQNDPQQIIVDAAGRIESVLYDVDLGFSPFDDEQVAINEMSWLSGRPPRARAERDRRSRNRIFRAGGRKTAS